MSDETKSTALRVFYPFTIGEFSCTAISDGSNTFGLDVFFANVPDEELKQALHPSILEGGAVTTPLTCLHVTDGRRSILVDGGAGHKVAPTAGRLLQNMHAAGLSPADVDTVILTHGHADHIGGLLDEGGRPLFPNARYVIWQAELDFWASDQAYKQAPAAWVQLARRQFMVLRSRIEAIDSETQILDGVRALACFGHTPGHMAVAIESGGERLLHVSDAALSPMHLQHPGWTLKYDVDPVQAVATKRQLFDRAAAEQTLIFAHHFPPFPALGRVEKDGDGWLWRPVGNRSRGVNPRSPFDDMGR